MAQVRPLEDSLLELVEEPPIGVFGDDPLRAGFGDAYFAEPEGVKAGRYPPGRTRA